MLDTTNHSLLGLFFLYLVILSGESSGKLLNCKVQSFVKSNIYIQHFLFFISIFLFTFILNWYTPSSLVLSKSYEYNIKKPADLISNKYSYIFNSFKNSFIIYLVFLLSTKLSSPTQVIFFGLLFLLFIVFLFYKIELEDKSLNEVSVNNFFISKEYLNQITSGKDITQLYLLHNGLSIGYFTMGINFVYGIFKYYKKQRKDHEKDWSLLKFVFGVDKCSSM
jgi:hypothetical protein